MVCLLPREPVEQPLPLALPHTRTASRGSRLARFSSYVLLRPPQTHVFIFHRFLPSPTQEPIQSTLIARRIKFMSVDACALHSRLKVSLIIAVIQAVQSWPLHLI